MGKQERIHFYDRETMVYTACWRLPKTYEAPMVSDDKNMVDCPDCLERLVKGQPRRSIE